MLRFERIGNERGDCTARYSVILDKEYTVTEFICAAITRDADEWGSITITRDKQICYPVCEYRGAMLEGELPEDLMKKRIVSVIADGGWSRMDYYLEIERENEQKRTRAIDANALLEKIKFRDRFINAREMFIIDGEPTLTLNTLRDEIYQDAIEHGLFEEFDRIEDPVKKRRKLAMRIMEEAAEMYAAADDPEHYAEEAADVTLMTGDVCGYLGIDWHGAVMSKKEYNKTRPWKHEEAKAMKAMISQPMGGKSNEEIVATRERAIAALEEKGFEVVNTLFTDEWYSDSAMKERGVENVPLCFLAKSLENMSLCNAAYFCKGWEHARGCRIEYEAAKAYNMTILYEE